MKREHSRQGRWLPLLLILILGLLATPIGVSLASPRATKTTPLHTTIYLTEETLKPLFQEEIDAKVPLLSRQSIEDMMANLPPQSQGWAGQMANALIKPGATITDMTPQKDGIAITIQVRLYQGDPRPVESKSLIKFSPLDSTTIQVSAQPISGAALINGPLSTIKVPMGKLEGVNSTPNCSDCALAIKLKIDVPYDESTATASAPSIQSPVTYQRLNQRDQTRFAPVLAQQSTAKMIDAYVEISQNSLDTLAQGIDKLPVNKTMKAQNLRITIKGDQIILTADLAPWDTGIALASTTTTIKPATTNGIFHFKVQETKLSVAFLTFDANEYNQQIATLLNSRLIGALNGKFTVTGSSMGVTKQVPCASKESLILTGKTSIE